MSVTKHWLLGGWYRICNHIPGSLL